MLVSRKRVFAPRALALRSAPKKRRSSKKAVSAISNFNVVGPRIGVPLGPRLKCKFRVSSAAQVNPGAAGAIAVQTLKANSLFDPTGSFGADQPRGFDQLSLLYQRYRVNNVRISAKFVQGSTVALGASIVGMQFTDSVTAPTSYRDCVEDGYSVWDAMGIGTDNKVNLNFACDVKKFKAKPTWDDALTALTSADPAELIYCHIFIQAVDSGVDLGPAAVLVVMDFDAEMIDPINVAAS